MWQYLKIAILFLVILTLFFRIHNFISHICKFILYSQFISQNVIFSNLSHFISITFFIFYLHVSYWVRMKIANIVNCGLTVVFHIYLFILIMHFLDYYWFSHRSKHNNLFVILKHNSADTFFLRFRIYRNYGIYNKTCTFVCKFPVTKNW